MSGPVTRKTELRIGRPRVRTVHAPIDSVQLALTSALKYRITSKNPLRDFIFCHFRVGASFTGTINNTIIPSTFNTSII